MHTHRRFGPEAERPFDEPQNELCPKTVKVWITMVQGGVEVPNTRKSILVQPVHTWWTTSHRHGPGGQTHPPDTSDFTKDYNYLRWKYADVLATTGGFFTGVTISANGSVWCGTWPFQTSGYACTTDTSVVFGTSTFASSENQAVSIIGHELVHAALGYGAGECPAYRWEADHAAGTSIYPCDGAYLSTVNLYLVGHTCPP